MPSVSKKQHNFMAAIANNPAFAKKVGIKQSVGKEFTAADKSKKFKEGGMAESKKMVKKEVSFMKKKGAPKSMIKHEMGEMKAMKRGGAAKKMAMGGYADGGMPMVMKDGQKVPAFAADGKGKMAKGGMAASKMGKVRTAAPSRDGVAMKGKTKGMMPKMAGNKGMKKGGYC
jgi:hypothetical protein